MNVPRLRALLFGVSGLLAAACATHYGEYNLARPGGYNDERLAANRWRVDSRSTPSSGADFSTNMALVRGAILAKAAGFSIIHVVNLRIIDFENIAGRAGQAAHLTIVGTNDAAAPLSCEGNERFAKNCRILPVDAILETLAPRVGLTPAQVEQEVARTRAAAASAPAL